MDEETEARGDASTHVSVHEVQKVMIRGRGLKLSGAPSPWSLQGSALLVDLIDEWLMQRLFRNPHSGPVASRKTKLDSRSSKARTQVLSLSLCRVHATQEEEQRLTHERIV